MSATRSRMAPRPPRRWRLSSPSIRRNPLDLSIAPGVSPMASAWRYAATAAFMIVVLVSGILHGMQTFRWDEKPKLDGYLARLDAVPASFDDWESKSDKFDDDLTTHGIDKYILRIYSNRRTTEVYKV